MALWLLSLGGAAAAAEPPPWVERLAFWAAPELKSLKSQVENIDQDRRLLPTIAGVNSGNRNGFQSAGSDANDDMWVEVEFTSATPVDTVVMVPLLAKGSHGEVPGFGFPRRFLLEGFDESGETILLMDETSRDFQNPGLYPVVAQCPRGERLKRIRLTATEPWGSDGPPVLALSEMMVLRGNRNMALKAQVRASSSRELSPTWSRSNLVDMITPLGLPIAPSAKAAVMGWHGPVASSMNEVQAFTVDLGQETKLDEIRLIPAWRSRMAWDSYYGFPARFKLETALARDFTDAVTVHDRTASSLLSPGQNLLHFATAKEPARYVRMTATRLRNRTGDYVFALSELQAYSGDENIAKGAEVSASELQGDPEWRKQGLTDGIARGGDILELPEWIRRLEERRLLDKRRRILIQRRAEVFSRAEHTLVGVSVGGAGGIVVIAGLLSWRGRRHRIMDRERHRERLARDLHDELGSNLGSIALISSLAAHGEAPQMRLDLAEIEQVARESADSMRDMVSLLGGKRGGAAADWLNVMTGLAERLMRDIELECRLPTSPLTREPNLETKREIYLFCKEVLHNAARHGSPSTVKFHLSPTSGGLRIEISDDGCGFDPSTVKSGHGLGNLRERGAMMKAEMSLASSPGKGTRVILDVPRSRRWAER
jgi:signal transduction histidine kinase